MLSVKRNRYKIGCVFFSGLLAFLTTAGAKPTLNFDFPASFRALRSSKSNNYGTSEAPSTFAPFVSIPLSFSNFVAQKQARNMKSYR